MHSTVCDNNGHSLQLPIVYNFIVGTVFSIFDGHKIADVILIFSLLSLITFCIAFIVSKSFKLIGSTSFSVYHIARWSIWGIITAPRKETNE